LEWMRHQEKQTLMLVFMLRCFDTLNNV
jgi:hypothetical protein